MLRRRKAPADPFAHIDPSAVPFRWTRFVEDAVVTRQRWHDLVRGLRPGPVRDRLTELGARVDEGALAVWEAVLRAVEVQRLADGLDAERITAEYKDAKRDPGADPALAEALAARFGAVQRVLNAIDDTEARLRLLDARLGAAVARAAEVAVTAGAGSDDLGAELDAVVGELGSLRESLESLG